jgi:hypothetical protein
MGDALEVRGEQLLFRIAGDLAHGRIDLQPPALRGGERHAKRRRAEGGPKPLFALPERLLGQLALRDVSRYALDGDDVPGVIVDRLVALFGPDQDAVLAIPAQHERLLRGAKRAL